MSHFSDNLRSAPFIRLLVFFIAGIVLGDQCPPEQKWIYLCFAFCFLMLLPFLVRISYQREVLFGIVLFPTLFFLGLFLATDLRYVPQPLPKGDYYAVIDEFPIEKERSYKADIRLIDPKIKVIAYFEKSDSIVNIEPGMIFWFRGKPELLQKTGNPFEFDYQDYAVRQGTGHRIFLKKNNFYFLHDRRDRNLVEYSLIVRDRLLKIIEKCGLKGEVFHLVSAIALGAREDLEPETTQSFSKTGVIHVLAVSGMNVGIIFVVINVLLGFLKKWKIGIILNTLLILCAIWGYALITGMSASVIRAAAMFSFIVAGMNMSRHPNIYNTLAGSAFILLCFNPFLIYDVGFQLSYAAVFSIVFFHPFIYGLLFFKYWVPDQIWILISVSIAAQIGTFPLLLHYFHQFPTWFLLANLMVIPTVTIILYLSCILFAIAPLFPPIGVMLAHLLDWAGQWMFFSVHFVEKLPYSILDGLYPSDITLFLFVLFAILFTVYIIHKNKPALYCALISVAILFIIKDLSKYNTLLQKEVVVFNLQGKLLVALTSGEETIWITSENNTAFDKLNYYTKPYEGNRGIKKSSIISLTENSPQFINQLNRNRNFINFEGLSLFILNEHNQSIKNSENFPHSDLVILNNINFANQLLSIKNLAGSIIVETGTAAVAEENTDKSLSPSNGIKVLNTSKNGAVILTIKRVSQGNKNIIDCLYSKSL